MDVFLLIITIIVGICLIIGNVYILAIYCHPDDTGFGSNLINKIIVVRKLIFYLLMYIYIFLYCKIYYKYLILFLLLGIWYDSLLVLNTSYTS